jgi:hypothetical protein
MIRPLLALSALAALAPAAHAEDAAHRADRLRTIALNRQAQAAVDRRDRANANVAETNRKAAERYERERAEWRKRFDACQGGDWSACQH